MLTRRGRDWKVRAINQLVQVDPSLLLGKRSPPSDLSITTLGFMVKEGFVATEDMAATNVVPRDDDLVRFAVLADDADVVGFGGPGADVARERSA